jgi:hypothetical protein
MLPSRAWQSIRNESDVSRMSGIGSITWESQRSPALALRLALDSVSQGTRGFMTFSATTRRGCSCSALYTTAMPPSPMKSIMR